MKLSLIIEGMSIKKRVLAALKGEGKSGRGGIFGVMDEFDCDIATVNKYLQVLSLGTYGENDIDDKILHRARAPQNLLKLLKHFGVNRSVISKLLQFHIDNKKAIDRHQPSPNDTIVIQQFEQNERLVGMLTLPLRELKTKGFNTTLVPWYDEELKRSYPDGIWYVCMPENQDIVDELLKHHDDRRIIDILHGLAFGYQMSDVFNYVRSHHTALVDKICGHVDALAKN